MEGRGKRREGRDEREEARGKREEGRGKRKEGRGKRERKGLGAGKKEDEYEMTRKEGKDKE